MFADSHSLGYGLTSGLNGGLTNGLTRESGYYVSTSDGASTCSSSTGDTETPGTLLVLEPKSLRSFTSNDEYLYAMKEDLADWFSCLYKHDISADTFLNVLETGVLLCQHANKVRDFAKQRRDAGATLEMRSYFIRSVPEKTVSYREGVKPETFQARDNVSNFISWSRDLGIPDVLSFETDDLVLRKNERSVVLCLLEIARVGAKLGMLAPTLVQMEEEIDAEIEAEREPERPPVQIKTCDLRSLDERVRDLIGRCTCPMQFPMVKVSDGKYRIGDSRNLIFVRILRNHVMVRVGGGWDTLENYLNKHDPCQCNYRGHRAGSVQHKVTAAPQRRSSVPAQPRAPNTPTSPRRASAVVPPHARSESPKTPFSSKSPAPPGRSKSPTLIISRHTPVKSGTPTLSQQQQQKQQVAGSPGVSSSWSPASSMNGGQSSSQSVRSPSPAGGAIASRTDSGLSRLRSPSPKTTVGPQSSSGAAKRPQVLRTSSSSALLNKAKTPEGKTSSGINSSALKRGQRGTFQSDIEEDEGDEYDVEEDEDEDVSAPPSAQHSDPIEPGSVSFDERTEFPDGVTDSPDGSSTSSSVNGGKKDVSMDKISTMTLTEFKSLLSSALTVPEKEQQLQQQSNSSHEAASRQQAFDSLREKARSVRDSISTKKGGNNSSSNADGGFASGRRSLPQSPMQERRVIPSDRPKTPVALRRNANNAATTGTPPASRPKTPTSIGMRPKTPTSGVGYRPKTPSNDSDDREYKMARAKTPSQIKRDAVAKVAGAISNWVESRHDMDSAPHRPKTPTSRPKTPVRPFTPSRSRSCDVIEDDDDEIAGVLASPQLQSVVSMAKERPQTPSRIPKPCFTPRPETPKVSSSEGQGRATPVSQPAQQPSSINQSHTSAASQHHQKTLPATSRAAHMSRSNSNTSSVKSYDENIPSPVSDKSFASSVSKSSQNKVMNVISRRQQPATPTTNSNVSKSYKDIHTTPRRSVTPGPGNNTPARTQPPRSTTPGPYGKPNGERSAPQFQIPNNNSPGTRRRASLSNTPQGLNSSSVDKQPSSPASVRKASSVADLNEHQLMLTNEITFSDDEEINELVLNAAKLKAAQIAANDNKRVRSASVDARKLLRKNREAKAEEVLMVKRNTTGQHGVQVVKQNQVKYDSTPKANVVKRPLTRGNSSDRPNAASTAARFRSQTPDPSMFRQKLSNKVRESDDSDMNRTEAWVDSTLSDTKRKTPVRTKRAVSIGKDIPASELTPRPLEELTKLLYEPPKANVETLEAPPEDPEMFRKMERLFEKYREMELRASVNETPGGGPVCSKDKSTDSGSSARANSHKSANASSRSSPSLASFKTSTGSHGSTSGGVSVNAHSSQRSGTSSPSVTKNSGGDDNRFTRSTSVPGSFQQQLQTRGHRSVSNSASNVSTPAACESKSFPGEDAANSYRKRPPSRQGSNASSSADTNSNSVASVKDIDTNVAKNPAALVSKIKEILKVRPRKDENSSIPTRIPAPAGLSSKPRSKSVSNLLADEGVSDKSRNFTTYASGDQKENGGVGLSRASSTSSGNVAYSEFIYSDETADEVSQVTRNWTDRPADYFDGGGGRSESSCGDGSKTPVPKLSTPLITGRSTFINRRYDTLGRGLSQEKENNLSNSQSSLSSRSTVLSTTEDDGEYV